MIGVGVAVVVAVIVAAVVVAAPLVFHRGSGNGNPSGVLSRPSCTGDFTNPSSSFVIPTSAPAANALVGTWLTITYEVRALFASPGTSLVHVTVPTVSAVFPTQGGSALVIQLPPRTVPVSTSYWSDGNGTSHSRPLNTTTNFQGNATAYLSTSKIAVTSPEPYGSLAVELRWEWILSPPGNGGVLTSSWTTPTPLGPASSELYPAAAVPLLSTSGANATIGSNFSLALSGATSGTSLLLKLENVTTGATLREATVVAPQAAGASFNASIPLVGISGALLPGKYILHVHDTCGALLYSLTIYAHYAAQASITAHIVPASCGAFYVDGIAYRDNGNWSGVPSAAAHAIAAPQCGSHTFQGWAASGAVSVASPAAANTSAVFSGSGTLTARFG